MKKSDLKTGMKVVLDNSKEFIVLLNVLHDHMAGYGRDAKNILVNPKKDSYDWYLIESFSDDLIEIDSNVKIIKIYKPKHPYDIFYNHDGWELIWERSVTRKTDDLGRIVIPKEIRIQLGINEGDNLGFKVENGKIILSKE